MGRSTRNLIVKRIFKQMELVAAEPCSPLNKERCALNTMLEWVDHYASTGELVKFQEFKTRIHYPRQTHRPRLAG